MTSQELRKKYLEFFSQKGHSIIPSASLIPENDPTTLFTGSGMQPMVPYLLGQKHPLGKKIVDSQRCFRTQDIDEVGDNRHTTCFEMLGNWSLGDYFKEKQIPWIFEFLTEEIKLDPKRLYVTVFGGKKDIGIDKDDVAVKLWQEQFDRKGIKAKVYGNAKKEGLRDGRIFYYDENKNWWSRAGVTANMPIGEPGGPDSEIFWDFGEKLGLHEKWVNEVPESFKNMKEGRKKQLCHVNCDCGRFVELGNNVFMQYVKTKKGFETLPDKNVDFGGGLERITMATIDSPDIFLIDMFKPIIGKLEELSGKKYNDSKEDDRSFRIIADHLKAATLLIFDGVVPSNVDQGNFTRRLIRRSIRYADLIGINKSFTGEIIEQYVDYYSKIYNISDKKDYILNEVKKEEEKFAKTLENGLKELNKLYPLGDGAERILPGQDLKAVNRVNAKDAFLIYQSYGFPLEMIQEELARRALFVDEKEFDEEFKKHQDLSRLGAEKKFKGGLADASEETTKLHTATHLLQSALRKVLGEHVFQKGSNITAERLRFDFTQPEKMTPDQIKKVEDLVNGWIEKDFEVKCDEMPHEKAKALGIMGLFEDKYGAMVKVYRIGEFGGKDNVISAEMCGGPHVSRLGELGKFKILKEEASSSGVRRIKAIVTNYK